MKIWEARGGEGWKLFKFGHRGAFSLSILYQSCVHKFSFKLYSLFIELLRGCCIEKRGCRESIDVMCSVFLFLSGTDICFEVRLKHFSFLFFSILSGCVALRIASHHLMLLLFCNLYWDLKKWMREWSLSMIDRYWHCTSYVSTSLLQWF